MAMSLEIIHCMHVHEDTRFNGGDHDPNDATTEYKWVTLPNSNNHASKAEDIPAFA